MKQQTQSMSGKASLIALLVAGGCALLCTGCLDSGFDSDSRGFMTVATVVANPDGGYICYPDGGGKVYSQSEGLAQCKRGYVSVSYTKDDEVTTSGDWHIDNAHVFPWVIYDIITPEERAEALASDHVKLDSCAASKFKLANAYNGYLDIQGYFNIYNRQTGQETPGSVSVVYDPMQQSADTMDLTLCYVPGKTEGWLSISQSLRTVSCDLTSLLDLHTWSDTVVVRMRGILPTDTLCDEVRYAHQQLVPQFR